MDNLKHWRPTSTANHVAPAQGYLHVDSGLRHINCLVRAPVCPGKYPVIPVRSFLRGSYWLKSEKGP
jgi:hypothetical protein